MKLVAAALLTCLLAAPARAETSEWVAVDGGAVRVMLAERADGTVGGVLDIALKPGWKTYWRDPGDAGVPPGVAISDGDRPLPVELSFPAPKRHADSYGAWAGYDHSVSLPLKVAAPARGPLDVNVFVGICQAVCVPLQADFTLTPGSADTYEDEAMADAVAELPEPAHDGFRVTGARLNGQRLLVSAEIPDAGADLFIAGNPAIAFGVPETATGGFSVPVLSREDGAQDEPLHYTLVGPNGAVSGTVSVD